MKNRFRRPPRAAQWILKLIYNDRGRFTHLGDFAQVYNRIFRDHGGLRARLWYWIQIFGALPWVISSYFHWSVSMLKNFFTTTVRYFLKRKGFTLINVVGLGFGIAVIILIGQFLYFELSFDRIHPNLDSIYQLADTSDSSYSLDYRFKERILAGVPQVVNAALYNVFPVEANIDNRVFEFEYLLYVDAEFFEIFGFPFLIGEERTSLSTVESLVLTESTARRLFGDEDPIGRPVLLDHQYEMFVSGVVKDLPSNSSFRAQMFASAENTREKRMQYSMNCEWFDGKDDSRCRYPYRIFLELSDNADVSTIEKRIASLFTGEDFRFPNTLALTPFRRSYLHSAYSESRLAHGNLNLLKILAGIGLLVLILAVVNYINLSTAACRYRTREIGVKKSIGVDRRSLILQFLGESVLLVLLASVMGLLIARVFLPFFNQFVEKPQAIRIFSDPRLFALFGLFVFLLGGLSGLYPAFVLSGVRPVQLLRTGGRSGAGGGRASLRNGLNVFQFTVTICLIAGLIVMLKQIRFVKHRDLGFPTERLLTLKLHRRMGGAADALLGKLRQYPGISHLSLSNGIPGKIRVTLGHFPSIVMDIDFLETYGLRLVAGRSLLAGDIGKACLINQAGLNDFDDGEFQGKKINDMEVVGVVSDFHFSSLHHRIGPMALMFYGRNWGSSHISIRLSGRTGEGLEFIRSAWMETCPEFPFEYHFLDDRFDAMYRKEENLARLISMFASLAIVISCLGLFGLALFSSEQRTKEIGIRRVLGSSVGDIVLMLTRTSLRWALLSNLIAWPIIWYAMSRWLEGFAYRTGLSWWVFAVSGAGVMLIAAATVGWQTLRAASADPVAALRCE